MRDFRGRKIPTLTDPNFEDHVIGNTHIFFWALGLLGVRDKKQGGIWYDHGLGLWYLMALSLEDIFKELLSLWLSVFKLDGSPLAFLCLTLSLEDIIFKELSSLWLSVLKLDGSSLVFLCVTVVIKSIETEVKCSVYLIYDPENGRRIIVSRAAQETPVVFLWSMMSFQTMAANVDCRYWDYRGRLKSFR